MLEKLLQMLLTIVLLQFLARYLSSLWGVRAGSLLSGFFSGLVSSTALTAVLAEKSKRNTISQPVLFLFFFGGILAMQLSAILLVALGVSHFQWQLLVPFSGPFIFTLYCIIRDSRAAQSPDQTITTAPRPSLGAFLKLAAFVSIILLVSNLLKNTFGKSGLIVLTFFISLFEVHGSIISNTQLLNSNSIDLQLLCALISISIISSGLSKAALLVMVGSPHIRKETLIWLGSYAFSAVLSWGIFLVAIQSFPAYR